MSSWVEPVLRSEHSVLPNNIRQYYQCDPLISSTEQGSHRLKKYLNLEGFLEKSLEIKPALKSTGKSLKSLDP